MGDFSLFGDDTPIGPLGSLVSRPPSQQIEASADGDPAHPSESSDRLRDAIVMMVDDEPINIEEPVGEIGRPA